MSNFYIVQKNGMPAIWQVDPQGIIRLLKRKSKAGFIVATKAPAKSRAEALKRLRELFPNVRPSKASQTTENLPSTSRTSQPRE